MAAILCAIIVAIILYLLGFIRFVLCYFFPIFKYIIMGIIIADWLAILLYIVTFSNEGLVENPSRNPCPFGV